MKLEDLVYLLFPLTWLAMMVLEGCGTGRRWPAVRLWRTRGVVFFMVAMMFGAIVPALLPAAVTAHHLFEGARVGIAGGVVVGLLAVTLVGALVHRAYHRYDVLWRWMHQLHHAPQRVDIAGVVMITPLEMVVNILLFELVTVFVLGLDPVAIALVAYLSRFIGWVPHFNIRTSRWLGFLIQRPEMHCVHHRRGFHAYNYSDLPLWDMLFGTLRNPREFRGDVGFENTAAARLTPLLLGRDVNAAHYGPRNRGSSNPASNPA